MRIRHAAFTLNRDDSVDAELTYVDGAVEKRRITEAEAKRLAMGAPCVEWALGYAITRTEALANLRRNGAVKISDAKP